MRSSRILFAVSALLLAIILLTSCGTSAGTPTTIVAPTSTQLPAATPTPLSPTEPPPPTLTETALPSPPPTDTLAPSPTLTEIPPFTLTSSAFTEGGSIPLRYAFSYPGQCNGQNFSPPLAWQGAPANTVSFVIIMDDPDAEGWVHWVQFDIPAEVTELPEAAGGPDIGVKGKNQFGKLGYGGPCPPRGTHRYVFRLYALDIMLGLPQGATKGTVLKAMEGHILATTQLSAFHTRY